MREEIVKADILIVGGGIADLTAATRAGEPGARVVLAEKANTRILPGPLAAFRKTALITNARARWLYYVGLMCYRSNPFFS